MEKTSREELEIVIVALQEKILVLETELNERGVLTIEQIVEPKDYRDMKAHAEKLEQEVEALRYILSFSGVQSLDMLATDLLSVLQTRLKQIAVEFENFPVGLEERNILKKIIHNLHSGARQLDELLK
ncbi:hypothetical protein SAMN04488499_1003107 [Sporomusa acidovorans]|nr:hypothetical protein [Sporomusa acidovorans]OZC18933.1 hypothetical protein SPACI_30190 [Sporomusa acidovorans DSM 3132]SDD69581.1 hypothetical protein SAMN04488499_1003107 [Sporomusa acidovorans]